MITVAYIRSAIQRMNLRIGGLSQFFSYNIGGCRYCHTTWIFVVPHSTKYSAHDTCEALCEKCWVELGEPRDRMPYYTEMWRDWNRDGMAQNIEFSLILEAVLRGG